MFERSEFLTLPIFDLHNWAPEGQWQRGRLFWVTFFGEAKKVTGCRATPDLQTVQQPKKNKPKTNQKPKSPPASTPEQTPDSPPSIHHPPATPPQ